MPNPKENKELYSHHIFLLPFKWSNKEGITSDEDFENICKAIKKDHWEEDGFDFTKSVLNYNEYHYFYRYVSEILYDQSSKKETGDNQIKHFNYKGAEHCSYLIDLEDVTYELEIDSVLLHLYYTGVGVLSFHLLNYSLEHSSPDDILRINQFGRRVFPPFFNMPADKVGTQAQFEEDGFQNLLPKAELAKAFRVKLPCFKDAFEERWEGYMEDRLDKKGRFKLQKNLEPFLNAINENYEIKPILDDRMFVVCWYGNKKIADTLSGNEKEENTPVYLSDEWWFKYVHVDAQNISIQNKKRQAEIIEKATNARWGGYGTFYGITDYSFVMLTPELAHLRKVDAAFLVNHLQTMYYKMAELALVQRATVQQFSDEIARISKLDKQEDDKYSQKVNNLQKRYIRFVNRIYFREVTAQIQGIELYDKLHEQSRLREQVEGLKQEIQELHNYTMQVIENERNSRLEQLSLLGTVFLPPSLILALFGVSVLGELNESCTVKVLFLLAGLIVGSSFVSFCYFKKRSIWFGRLLLMIMAAGIISPICISRCEQCQPDPPRTDKELPLLREQLRDIQEKMQKPAIPIVTDTLNHKIRKK